jgi:hypothetical protein
MEFAGGKRDVVDPEVRAYVASLVTAVGEIVNILLRRKLIRASWEEAVQTRMEDTYWEMTL